MKKISFIAISAAIGAIGMLQFLPFAHSAEGKGFSYETFSLSRETNTLFVTRGMFEEKEWFSCATAPGSCVSVSSSSLSVSSAAPADPFTGVDIALGSRKTIATPDGSRGAVIDAQGRVWGIDLRAKSPVSSTTETFAATAFSTLSQDGKWLAFYQTKTANKNERRRVVVSLETGKVYAKSRTSDNWDVSAETDRMFALSSDSKKLYYLSDESGHQSLYEATLAKLAKGKLSAAPFIAKKYTIADFLVEDNGTVIFLANRADPRVWGLFSYDPKTGEVHTIEKNASYGETLARLGSAIVFARIGECGARVAIFDPATRVARDLLPPPSSCATLGKAVEVRLGGVPAVVYLPDGYSVRQKYPLYIWLHGGPYRQSSAGYHPYANYGSYDYIAEMLRRAGVIVVKLDYRGSFGFGSAYAGSIRHSIGKGDVQDVMSALSAAKKKYRVSAAYLAGTSYGGYLAVRASVAYPKVFSGAVSVNGVMDWRALATRYSTPFEVHFSGDPSRKNAALYAQADIASRVQRVTTEKIILVAGRDDSTVPYWQSASLYDVFLQKGKTADLVTLEGENHALRKKSSISEVCKKIFGAMNILAGDSCNL